MTLKEMSTLRPTTKVENRVVVSEVTDCMQMRIMYGDEDKFTDFECGIDVITTQNGNHIIISNVGIYAWTFVDFAKHFIRYNYSRPFKYILFCDDSMNVDKEPVYITDDRLLRKAIKL